MSDYAALVQQIADAAPTPPADMLRRYLQPGVNALQQDDDAA